MDGHYDAPEVETDRKLLPKSTRACHKRVLVSFSPSAAERLSGLGVLLGSVTYASLP